MRRGALLLAGVVAASIVRIVPALSSGESVGVWVTKADQSQLLAPQRSVSFGADSTNGLQLNLNEHHRYQRMEGFGAALTDSSAWLIANKLSSSQRANLMKALFSSSGVGLSYLRIPAGASDFVAGGSAYTYDDMPPGRTDPSLAGFSIAHDTPYIIPVLQEAKSLNPSLRIMGSPWSAPAWMKTTGSLIGGTLSPSAFGSFADYLVAFVRAYQRVGVPIEALTVANEPQYLPQDYPGMWLSASDEAALVKKLSVALVSAGYPTKILGLDHNWGLYTYAQELLGDQAVRAALGGIAFHCYGGLPEHMARLHETFPDVAAYVDECTTIGPTTNWAGDFAWDMQNLIIGSARNWASSVIKWNVALDTSYGPHLGGCASCKGLVTIDQSSGAVAYNLDFYALGHISKFVQPGAYRIASSDLASNGLSNVAFVNPDGSKVLIAFNGAGRPQTFKVRWGGQSFAYSLASGAAATFMWKGTQATPGIAAAPTKLAAAASSRTVSLSWTFSPLADSYTVERAASSGAFVPIATGVTLPAFTDTGVADDTQYSYVVTAVNSLGESAPSTSVTVTPNAPPPLSAGAPIEAESFGRQSGVGLEVCRDSGGGEDVGYAEDGDYLGWERIDFGKRGYSYVSVRVASASSGSIEVRLGSPAGTRIATIPVSNSGGWQAWTTLKVSLGAPVTGLQAVYLVFRAASPYTGVANLNWIAFSSR